MLSDLLLFAGKRRLALMDGSDDYFVDEIVLDEEAIAALDEEESKFVATQHPRPTIPQPPAKRQKTAHGWNPPPQASRSYSIEDLDLPEISVKDGFYGLRGLSQRSASQRSVSSAATSSSSNAVAGPSVSRTHHVPPAAVPKPPAPLSRANSNHSRPRSAGANQRAPSLGLSNSSSYQRLYRQPSRSFVNSQHAPEPQQQPSAASVQPAMGQGVDSQRLQQELIALRNQLEEVNFCLPLHSDSLMNFPTAAEVSFGRPKYVKRGYKYKKSEGRGGRHSAAEHGKGMCPRSYCQKRDT